MLHALHRRGPASAPQRTRPAASARPTSPSSNLPRCTQRCRSPHRRCNHRADRFDCAIATESSWLLSRRGMLRGTVRDYCQPLPPAAFLGSATERAATAGRQASASPSDQQRLSRRSRFCFWPVIVFFHRVSPVQFFKKLHTILKKHYCTFHVSLGEGTIRIIPNRVIVRKKMMTLVRGYISF